MLVPATVATERLTLTPLTVEDAADMVDVLADERMYEFTGGRPPTLDELTDRYGRLVVGRSADGRERWFNWIVRWAGEPSPVGVVQATVAADGTAAEVAWEVGVDWQRRGVASEAASAMVAWLVEHGVSVVEACVHPAHVASGRVAARAGLEATSELVDGEVVWRGSFRSA